MDSLAGIFDQGLTEEQIAAVIAEQAIPHLEAMFRRGFEQWYQHGYEAGIVDRETVTMDQVLESVRKDLGISQ